ncbi:MAG: response regulator, partial [Verrucomicrobiota bacterium]
VEDEAAVREMACMVLERIGYRVLTAANGPAALEMRRQFTEPIPLLITDMIMPGGMTGLELAECMRLETPELKVLCTSGYSEALFRAQTDAIRFLQKPYHPQQLAEAVRATLEGSHATEKDQ